MPDIAIVSTAPRSSALHSSVPRSSALHSSVPRSSARLLLLRVPTLVGASTDPESILHEYPVEVALLNVPVGAGFVRFHERAVGVLNHRLLEAGLLFRRASTRVLAQKPKENELQIGHLLDGLLRRTKGASSLQAADASVNRHSFVLPVGPWNRGLWF
ncbi:unnamed protein product [Tilletia caries]|nr:unnamed protein product [Tilletia caries]